jgi:hypothetical protein
MRHGPGEEGKQLLAFFDELGELLQRCELVVAGAKFRGGAEELIDLRGDAGLGQDGF